MISPDAIASLNWQRSLIIGGIAAGIALLVSFLAYYQGANFILAVSKAKPIEKKDDPELFNVVEEMAISAGVPMPKVYLIHDGAPNAFATGRDPQHGIVAITTVDNAPSIRLLGKLGFRFERMIRMGDEELRLFASEP